MGFSGSSVLAASFCLTASLALTGCSLAPTAPASLDTATPGAIRGNVHGGQQPVVGAHVYLFAAGSTGYGGKDIDPDDTINSSISLLRPVITHHSDALGGYVLTGADGGFTLTGDYICTVGQQVYLYALGGDPGSGTNSSAGFLAIVGTCPAEGTFAASVPFVWINEITTVAAAYAFAGFASDATHVSGSNTDLSKIGIANAFANAASLVDIATGTALATTPNGNGIVPQMEINSLANTLAACVNSADTDKTTCNKLFVHARSSGSFGTEPNDTATAAINIAHHPGNAVSLLFELPSGIGAPFAPPLPATPEPTDLTIAINYTHSTLTSPFYLAIDGLGDAWVTNFDRPTVVKLSPKGDAMSGDTGYNTTGLTAAGSIAIDPSNSVWVTDRDANSITKLSNMGIPAKNSPFSDPTLYTPYGIAIDGFGNAWVPNGYQGEPLACCVTEFSNTGDVVSGSGYTGGGMVEATGVIAIDGAEHAWIKNGGDGNVVKLLQSGDGAKNTPYGGGGLSQPSSIAIDQSGNAWFANGTSSVSELSKDGVPVSNTAYTGGGLNGPNSIAIDGDGNAWIANSDGNSLTELSSAGAPLSGNTGYHAGLEYPFSLAVDGSGNVWVTNRENATFNSPYLTTEFIGAAAPVVTPLAAGIAGDTLGTRP